MELKMADITNSFSLTDFQRNAKGFIKGLKKSKKPLLLTVNGKVEAVLIDPKRFQKMETQIEKEKFIAALTVGLNDIDRGRTRPAEQIFDEIKRKYGFQD